MSHANTPLKRRLRLIVIIVVAVAALLATIHFTINGIPGLEFLNPHAPP